MSHWWTGIPTAEATVLCGESTHTVRWQAGELTAVDHHDPGGAVPPDKNVPCLELLRTWSQRADDPHILTLASRGPTDPLNINLTGLRFADSGPRRQTEEHTIRSLAVGGRLPDRLQATTAAIWTQRIQTGHGQLQAARAQLEAALYGRVLQALRAWLGAPALAITLTMIEPGEQRSIARAANGLEVSLPFSWLSDVWMRELTVTAGRFCIAAQTTDGPSWTLNTLSPNLDELTQLTIVAR